MSDDQTEPAQLLRRNDAARAAGDKAAAYAALRLLLSANEAGVAGDYDLVQAVAFRALAGGDLAGAVLALSPYFSGLRGLRLAIEAQRVIDINTVVWEISGDGTSEFRFCARLFTLPDGWMSTIVTRWIACLRVAQRYAADAPPPGLAFIDVGDWSSGPAMCFSDHRAQALLIPDSSFLGSAGYAAARGWGADGVAPAWDARQPVAVWRGSSTGEADGSLLRLPRAALCRLGLGADWLDAGITDVVQASSPEDAAALRDSGLCKPRMAMAEHARYKFQVDIDGNTNSWPGLFQKLLTGSPVLKVLSSKGYRQWYYPRLVPWQNYVPVASDLSDLPAIVHYLREHDGLARAIGAAGRALALDMTCDAELTRCLPTVEAAFALGGYTTRAG